MRIRLQFFLSFFILFASLSLQANDLQLLPVEKEESAIKKQRNLSTWELGSSIILVVNDQYMTYITLQQSKETGWFNFLSGDPVRLTHLETGSHSIIVDFKRNLVLRQFIIQSATLKGTLQLYASKTLNLPNSKVWKKVGNPINLAEEKAIDFSLGLLETRFLRLDFEITQMGDISSLSCMGFAQVSKRGNGQNNVPKSTKKEDLIPFNYARPYEGARVGYVTGGDPSTVNQVLNENFSESYNFPEKDTQAAMVIDLNEARSVDNVSVLFDSPPGTFNFVFLDEIPEGLQNTVIKTSCMYRNNEPILVLAAQEGSLGEMVSLGKVRERQKGKNPLLDNLPDDALVLQESVDSATKRLQINFKEINSRYVLIYWEANTDLPADSESKGLKIYQVNITGSVPPESVLPEDVVPIDEDVRGENETQGPSDQTTLPVDNQAPPVDPLELPPVSF